MTFQHFWTRSKSSPRLAFIFLGITAALGFAPINAFPFTLLSFALFYKALLEWPQTARESFRWSWYFGLGFFVVGLYWIALSLHVNWEKFGWIFPFALLGLPSILALFIGVVGLGLYNNKKYIGFTSPVQKVACAIFFAALWTLIEVVRGTILTGFPWQLASDIWIAYLPMAQPLAYMGSYGYSFVTILLALLPIALGRKGLLITITALMSIYAFGHQRLKNPTLYHLNLQVALIQPNIAQTDKWNRELFRQNLENMVQQSAMAPQLAKGRTIYIWPEASVPYTIEDKLLQYITSYLGPQDLLMFGSPFTDKDEQLYNSLFVVDQNGQIKARYDKAHLVPFGEYMPGRAFLPSWVGKITAGARDFSPGPSLETIELSDIPSFGPLICYEVIFPGEVINCKQKRPQWLVNITNDGWYLNSSGPYQHLQNAQARAIEEGIPVVRVANTGVSAVIDPYGRLITHSKYGEATILNAGLPKPIEDSMCYHPINKNYIFFIMLLMCVILRLIFYKRRKD